MMCLGNEERRQSIHFRHGRLSRPKDGVATAHLCPAIHVFLVSRKQDVDARHKAGHDEGQFLSPNSRRLGRALLRLDPPRQYPAEIGQRRVGADREQLIVRISVEHFLLRLDDREILVKSFFEAVAQRQCDVRIVEVEIVQIVPEEMRGAARLRRCLLYTSPSPRD